jgi:integrase
VSKSLVKRVTNRPATTQTLSCVDEPLPEQLSFWPSEDLEGLSASASGGTDGRQLVVSCTPAPGLPTLFPTADLSYNQSATPTPIGRRGQVPRRRFQKGSFVIEKNGGMYSMHYIDAERPDGTNATKQVKRFLGNLSQMSERAARREHARLMEQINQSRGSVMPLIKGQTFADAVDKWRQAIAPNLCASTVRQRESYLKNHIMPRFGKSALLELDVSSIQQFATDLRKTLSGKTTLNILGGVFTILDYAGRCGMRVPKVSFADLQLGSIARETPVAFFTREQATRIIEEAKEPFKTLFALAWMTGLRAGELLALTINDLNFDRKTIRVNKSSDDLTREIRRPKTKGSVALLPMPSALEGMLRTYIQAWKPNVNGLLFASRDGLKPRTRTNIVRNGLKPLLRKLGIPEKETGLHAFRHGLATELVEASVPVTVLQSQMRHADVRTSLKVYAHAIPESQRVAMENVGGAQSLRSMLTLLKFASK